MTARYRPRFFEVNAPASSVASTANPFSCPSFRIAAMPGPMELWRKPAVLEKTSTRDSWLCTAVGAPIERERSASETNRFIGGSGLWVTANAWRHANLQLRRRRGQRLLLRLLTYGNANLRPAFSRHPLDGLRLTSLAHKPNEVTNETHAIRTSVVDLRRVRPRCTSNSRQCGSDAQTR